MTVTVRTHCCVGNASCCGAISWLWQVAGRCEGTERRLLSANRVPAVLCLLIGTPNLPGWVITVLPRAVVASWPWTWLAWRTTVLPQADNTRAFNWWVLIGSYFKPSRAEWPKTICLEVKMGHFLQFSKLNFKSDNQYFLIKFWIKREHNTVALFRSCTLSITVSDLKNKSNLPIMVLFKSLPSRQ